MATQNNTTINPRLINLVGQKYGRLSVLSRAENTKSGQTRWNCLCECGNHVQAMGYNLRNKQSTSCGCYRLERAAVGAIKRRKNIYGQRFSMLLALHRDPLSSKGNYRAICKCDCGNIKSINISDLKRGHHKSCGCSKLRLIAETLTKPREHHLAYNRAYYHKRKENPVIKLEIRVRSCIASAFRYEGVKKNSKSSVILGCTYQELKIHIERQFTKGMCWERFSEIQIDHIIPMASAKTEDDVIKLNHHTNLRPMWAKENRKKSDSMQYLI
jgi:hypothetical protein